MIRPAVTLLATLATIGFAYLEIVGIGKTPAEWWPIVTLVLVWWFRARDDEHAGGSQ